MTKYQLFKALEPFMDEIEVEIQGVFEPHIFYTIDYDADAKIIIGSKKPTDMKCVELKV